MSERGGANKRGTVVFSSDTMTDQQQGHADHTSGEVGEERVSSDPQDAQGAEERGYHAYTGQADLQFCPLKDLNLPSSYSEVVSRFKRLQGDRDVEVLN